MVERCKGIEAVMRIRALYPWYGGRVLHDKFAVCFSATEGYSGPKLLTTNPHQIIDEEFKRDDFQGKTGQKLPEAPIDRDARDLRASLEGVERRVPFSCTITASLRSQRCFLGGRPAIVDWATQV